MVKPKSVEELAAERAANLETNNGDSESTTAEVDNRMKNMGIMFLIIAITILLICAAVVLRRKLIQNGEKDEKKANNETK